MLRKLFRIALPLFVLAAGFWFITRSSGPAPETVVRRDAIQSLAPAGINSSNQAVRLSGETASPVTVNLSDIPAGVYDPDNQLDRWHRGEIDLDEADGIRSNAEMAALREAALNLPPMTQLQSVQTAGISPSVPAADASFDSLDYNDCCGGGGNVPPDPELAVGPNHAIAVVNVAFEIYDKSGNVLNGPTTFASFMASNPTCTGVFDPNALYDEEADRYVLAIDADGTDYCIAVSQTGDPTGAWNIYAFNTVLAGGEFFDYPHAGVGRNAIYMGANIFTSSFLESRVWAFDKWAMYNGQTASSNMKQLGNNEDTPQPLNLHGWNQGTWPTSDPHYIITETGYNGADHTIWSWDDPFGADTFVAAGNVDLNAATGVVSGAPLDVPQDTGGTLQANDWRPQDFEFRNGYGWTSMTISCNPGSGSVNCVRWAQIDLSTMTVAEAGVYGTDGEHRFFADLAVNHCDDMAIGYSKSSNSMYPAVFYAGRESGDAAGTLQSEVQLKAGEIEYTSFEATAPRRWGDYTEMTIAPDGETFWYLGEYSKNTGTSSGRWGTWIASVNYGTCDGSGGNPPTPTPIGPTATPTDVPPTATPGPGGSTFTYNPVADAYVRSRRGNENYGTANDVRVDNRPETNGYLRFDVQGLDGSVSSATLRLYVEDGSSIGYDVHSVTNNTWGETSITFNNAPAVGAVLNASGNASASTWIDVDVTAHVTGDGLI
ncbi:MAG: DNRLRE domain-containing protein, partial [Chloroflexi bacterium]|nr:DNRLRE domain-containing protein [Chloroflexota bacterium]